MVVVVLDIDEDNEARRQGRVYLSGPGQEAVGRKDIAQNVVEKTISATAHRVAYS